MIQPADRIDVRPVSARVALRLRRQRGGTVGLALIFLALVAGTCELLVRTAPVRAKLLAPSLGSSMRDLELRWFGLEDLVAKSGPIDCLLVGSSTVRFGLDPAAFADAYRDRTGCNIRCFNFGMAGVTTSTAGVMAEILVQRYHPALLIYGLTPFELNQQSYRVSQARAAIEDLPWTAYQLGTFNSTGWLIEHSYAYRYYLTHRNWMRDTYWWYLRKTRLAESYPASLGYYGTVTASRSIAERPSDREQRVLSLGTYTLSDQGLAGLGRIARLSEQGVHIAIVEMPLPRTLLTFFPHAKAAYEMFAQVGESAARAHHLPFLRTTSLGLIPDDGWADYGHMNAKGGEIFGRWLGEQVAELGLPDSVPGSLQPNARRSAGLP
jgi:hypothetical protein